MDLFEEQAKEEIARSTPLADRMRPATLATFIGQSHLVSEGKVIRREIESNELVSMIFWGPPGVGKTSLARIIAASTRSDFYSISAVTAGVADIRKIIEKAKANRRLAKGTILFIDEIHRFNKAQQDALLHSVEDGTILLIGATTENPSFEVISALLSRCRVYHLQALTEEELLQLVRHAVAEDKFLKSYDIRFEGNAEKILIHLSGGDARTALNALELTLKLAPQNQDNRILITEKMIQEALQSKVAMYDKKGEYHYDVISAFIKSVRGSDPDAALYWLARMIDAGEDPKFIARRLIILASEDVGNADPNALTMATSAFTAVTYIGMPEGRIILAQATTYLASAPKSNAAYRAIAEAMKDISNSPPEPVPLHLRNAPTRLMKEEGYAEGYLYAHDYPYNFVVQKYLPEKLTGRIYYKPTENGVEKRIKERLHALWSKYRDDGTKKDHE